jgi:hypothetical protein
MRFTEDAWKMNVARLTAAYSTGGRHALAKMNFNERNIIFAEVMVDLREAKGRLQKNPEDELAQIRMQKAEREIEDIGGYGSSEKFCNTTSKEDASQ